MVTVANCLEPMVHNDINDEIKTIIGKYISKVPDIKSRYVINDALSNVINHYFKGKITTFPLYKISLTIDRNPVKIPWTLDAVDERQEDVIQRSFDEQRDKNRLKQREYKVNVPEWATRAKLSKRVTETTPTPTLKTTQAPTTTVE